MQNVEIKIEGNKATIVIDVSKTFGPSKSGKTLIVASTAGFVQLAPGVSICLNAVKKAA